MQDARGKGSIQCCPEIALKGRVNFSGKYFKLDLCPLSNLSGLKDFHKNF